MPFVSGAITPITTADLTTQTVGGDGVFDVLMTTLRLHLKDEYNNNRITGQEYTKAYIAMTQAAMAAAVQFLLGRDEVYWKEVNAEAQKKLILEQMEAARAQTQNTRSNGTTPVVGLIGKQKELYAQQIDSYQVDGKTKVAKIFSDAFITMKTVDEGLLPPDGFVNANLDVVLEKLQAAVDLDADV